MWTGPRRRTRATAADAVDAVATSRGAASRRRTGADRTRKGDGPRRGDNGGRQCSGLRGGGAGTLARSTSKGSALISSSPHRGADGKRVAVKALTQEDGTSRTRCHPDRETSGVPSVILLCRSGTSPPRSVHQWTARAWVPGVSSRWSSGSRPSACSLCTRVRRQNGSLDFPDISGRRAAGRNTDRLRRTSAQPSGPHRVGDPAALLRAGDDRLPAVGQPQRDALRRTPAYAASAPR